MDDCVGNLADLGPCRAWNDGENDIVLRIGRNWDAGGSTSTIKAQEDAGGRTGNDSPPSNAIAW
jgi:hypothetical protein